MYLLKTMIFQSYSQVFNIDTYGPWIFHPLHRFLIIGVIGYIVGGVTIVVAI